jgi:catechol 2,3-dioxygenase-like lactoylglutathione lyase family enzyme
MEEVGVVIMKIHSAVFYSENIDVIEDFYINLLGFDLDYRSGDTFISFKVGEGARLGIKKHTEAREIPGHQTVFVEVDLVEEYYRKLVEAGIEILKPLTEEIWATEFTILDPDGNKVLFRNSGD